LPSVVAGVWLGGAASVLAHGPVPEEPPSLTALLLEWTFPPLVTLGILVAGLAWWAAIRRIRRRHPANPVPRSRSLAIIGALAVLGFALASGIERYDTTLFWVICRNV
jgi:cytochrome c oxidase assembly factor CtaG